MLLMRGISCSCAYAARASLVETVSMASTMQSMLPLHAAKQSLMSASRFSGSTNASRAITVHAGLMSAIIPDMTSIFRRPTVLVNAMAWRLILLGATTSLSTMTSLPMHPRASASTQLEPTPPQPKTITVAACSRARPSSPMMMRSLSVAVSCSCMSVLSSVVFPLYQFVPRLSPASYGAICCPWIYRAALAQRRRPMRQYAR